MKIGAIVQARMGSTRLPEKVMKDIDGKPMLEYLVNRLEKSSEIDTIILATSTNEENDVIEELAEELGVEVFRGSEEDVLDRIYRAAYAHDLDAVVRITGDCPFIDPAIVDRVVELFEEDGVDYASNIDPPTFPDGMDVEVFTFQALEEAAESALAPHYREHVTPYIREKEDFESANLEHPEDLSEVRVTVDTPEDLEVVRDLAEVLHHDFSLDQLLEVLDERGSLPKAEKGRDWKFHAEKEDWEERNLQKSQELFATAKDLIPAQTQTLSKGQTQFVRGVCPVFIERGEGSHVWDVDGNEYIDYMLALGPVILGYNYETVDRAVREQLEEGITFSLPHPLEVELAEKLEEVIPCAEMVRYGKNGSDATSAAVRLARAHTEREKIACCGYHGWQDWYITTKSRDAGVPEEMDELIETFEYNDIESLKKLFEDNPREIAGVIMEPISTEEPEDDFLEKVKEVTHENDAVLIFDEVVTGFRVSMGGAQELYGVAPDVACFGKGVANGMPLAIVAGKEEIMKDFEDVFFSITSGGETLSLAAAMATIEELEDKNVLEQIWERGEDLQKGIEDMLEERNLPVKTRGLPVHFVLLFENDDSLALKSLFVQETVKRGLLAPGYFNTSYSHTEKDVKETLEVLHETFDIMEEALEKDDVEERLEGPKVEPVFREH